MSHWAAGFEARAFARGAVFHKNSRVLFCTTTGSTPDVPYWCTVSLGQWSFLCPRRFFLSPRGFFFGPRGFFFGSGGFCLPKSGFFFGLRGFFLVEIKKPKKNPLGPKKNPLGPKKNPLGPKTNPLRPKKNPGVKSVSTSRD